MAATYKHHLWTGSGWREVILAFTDDGTALVEYDGRSMGNNPLRYRLHCITTSSQTHTACSAFALSNDTSH